MNDLSDEIGSPIVYIELCSPIEFLPIGSPIIMMGDKPSDQFLGDVLSDRLFRERPSDEHCEKGSPMNIGAEGPSDGITSDAISDEHPSDEHIREATANLLLLTECRCGPEWTDRDRHAPECVADHRVDVVVLVAAALGAR